jgi:hypothetical protein
MVNSNTDKVREVERRVVDIYTKSDTSNKDVVCSIQSLMMMRWNMMHHGIMWDDEFVAKLDAMNEQMKQALIAMRYKTLDVYEYLKLRCPEDMKLEVMGRLYVDDMDMEGWEYESDMWANLSEILQTPAMSRDSLYADGITYPLVFNSTDNNSCHSCEECETMYMLYREKHYDNWNEHMDSNKTGHMHIIYGVHNMIDHCHWTLQDLINVKSYKTKIEVEYSNKQ